jgi:uncharacterized protein with PIN domain
MEWDLTLFREARRRDVDAFLVKCSRDEEMLASVGTEHSLVLYPVGDQCTFCSAVLNKVSRDELVEEVPQKTLKGYDKFWQSSSHCEKVYSHGSYWERIVEEIFKTSRITDVTKPENSL